MALGALKTRQKAAINVCLELTETEIDNFCVADLPPSPANAYDIAGSTEGSSSARQVMTSQFNEKLSKLQVKNVLIQQ